MESPLPAPGWKVPVDRARVSLHLEGGKGLEGLVFLQVATEKGRAQSVLDLLNDDTHFLAVEEGGNLRLIHKGRIRWCEGGDRLLPPDQGVPPDVRSVRMEFAYGIEVRGEALIAGPPGRRRVLDLLNGPEAFFPLLVEGEPRIVHKRHVQMIEPIDS